MSKNRMQDIEPKLFNLPPTWEKDPLRMCRRQGVMLMEEGTMRGMQLKPRWCFIFNDYLLLTKPQCDIVNNATLADPKTRFKYKVLFKLDSICIDERKGVINQYMTQTHELAPFVLHAYEPSLDKDMQCVFSTTSVALREQWMTDIFKAVIEARSQKLETTLTYGWIHDYWKGSVWSAVKECDEHLLQSVVVDSPLDQSLISSELSDLHGSNLLHIAAAANNVGFITQYGAKFDGNAVDRNNRPPLRIAANANAVAAMKALLKLKGINAEFFFGENESDETKSNAMDDRSLLHEMAKRGNHVIIDTLLSDSTINIEGVDKAGRSPLHIASRNGQEEAVITLLQYGAPPNLPDYNGNRPIHVAVSAAVARWLCVYGARLDTANKLGHTGAHKWNDQLDKYITFRKKGLQAKDAATAGTIIDEAAWFDDEFSESCLACQFVFTKFKRRHHCRQCGLLCCGNCWEKCLIFIDKESGKPKEQKVCDKCYNRGLRTHPHKMKYSIGVDTNKQWELTPVDYVRLATFELTTPGSAETERKNLPSQHSYAQTQMQMEVKVDDLNIPKNPPPPKPKHAPSQSENLHFKRNAKSGKGANDNKGKTPGCTEANALMSQTNEKASRNLEKTKILADKSDETREKAANFADLAKQLADKEKKGGWW